jgi:Regulator of chromosome condensation (RCC1) repeat
VPSGLSRVTAIAAGFRHSLALKSDGTVVAWGCNASLDSGQCKVPSGLSRVTGIAAGDYHSLALVEPMTPAPCRVPNVVGKGIASAKLAISQRLPYRKGELRLLEHAQEGHRHLPKPPAWKGASGALEDQPRRQSGP